MGSGSGEQTIVFVFVFCFLSEKIKNPANSLISLIYFLVLSFVLFFFSHNIEPIIFKCAVQCVCVLCVCIDLCNNNYYLILYHFHHTP